MNCLDANFIAALHFNVARQTETAERFVRSGLTRGNRGNGEKGLRFLRYLLFRNLVSLRYRGSTPGQGGGLILFGLGVVEEKGAALVSEALQAGLLATAKISLF